MTDFFILAVAVFLAVALVRLLTLSWPRTDDFGDDESRMR
jgi:hypothetical protein